MDSRQAISGATHRALHSSVISLPFVATLIFFVVSQALNTSLAATYIYTPIDSTSDQWSTSTNWSAIPVSNYNSELTFVGDNAMVLPNSMTNTNVDDLAGAFSLNILNLQGTGPTSEPAVINIDSVSPDSYLRFSSAFNQPIVNFNAMAGSAGLTYNINTNVILNGSPTFQGDGTATFQINGDIGGAAILTKTGSSKLILAGANTFGSILVSDGVLQIGDGAARLGSVSGFINNNAQLVIANGTDQSFAHISGSGTLTKTGAGKLILTSYNDFIGDTIVRGGILELGYVDAIWKSTLDYDNYGGQLSFGSVTRQEIGGIKGSQDLALSGSMGSAIALTIGGNNQSTTYGGVLSGSGSLKKVGIGTLALAGANTYTGNTTITEGKIHLSNANALQNSAVDVDTDYGLTFAPGIGAFTIGSLGGVRKLDLTDGSGNAIQLIVGSNNNTTNYQGIISGTGSITKVGTGSLMICHSNAGTDNTYSGGTTLCGGKLEFTQGDLGSGPITFNGGTLRWQVGNSQDISSQIAPIAIGQAAVLDLNASTVSFASPLSGPGALTVTSGTLNLTVANSHIGGTNINGTISFVKNALCSGPIAFNGGTLRWSAGNRQDISSQLAPITGSATLDTNGNNVSFTSILTGDGSLRKTGSGNLLLTAANTYSGRLSIYQGTVRLANSHALQNSYVDISTTDNNLQFAPGIGTFTLAGLSGRANVNLTDINGDAVTLEVGNDNINQNYDVTFSGTGSLTKNGYGILNLNNASSHSGGTTLKDGTIYFAKDALGTGDILFAGGTLRWANGNTQDISDQISSTNDQSIILDNRNNVSFATPITGSSSVTKTGSGTLIFASENTYTGVTNISGGTLQLGDGINDGSIKGDIANNWLLIFANEGNQTYDGVISGAGSVQKSGDGKLILGNESTYSGCTTLSNGILQLNSADTLQYSTLDYVGGKLSFGTLTNVTLGGLKGNQTLDLTNEEFEAVEFKVKNNNSSTIYSGELSGKGSFKKLGAGKLSLTGTNSYTGSTTISEGVLSFAQGSLDTTSSIIFDGGTLSWDANNSTDVSGRIVPISAGKSAIIDTGSNNITFASPLSGAGGLTKKGSGTLTLSNSNSYSGDTVLNKGTLVFASGALDSSSAIDFNGGTLCWASSNTQDISSRISSSSRTTNIDTNGNDISFATPLSGNIALGKNGTGTLALTTANEYTGGTTISGGVLSFVANGLGPSGGIFFSGGTLQWAAGNNEDISSHGISSPSSQSIIFDTNGNDVSFVHGIGGFGGLDKNGEGTLTLTGQNKAKYITINAGSLQLGDGLTNGFVSSSSYPYSLNVTNNGRLVFNTNMDAESFYNFSNPISGTGSVTKTGVGKLVLTGTHTYTGETIIDCGTLQIGDGSSWAQPSIAGDISNNANLVFSTGTVGNSMYYHGRISGTGSVTIEGSNFLTLTGEHTYTGGTINNGKLYLGDGTYDGSIAGNITNNRSLTFRNSNNQTYSDVISGTGSVTKSGNGTLILTNENTYTGNTYVYSGTLQLGDGVSKDGSVAGNISGDRLYFTPPTLVFANLSDQSYSGVISGYLDIVKNGKGTLTLSGENFCRGTTTINDGTLAFGADNILPIYNSVILDGGKLATNGFNQIIPLSILVISSDSIIDMADAAGSTLNFYDSSMMPWSGTLTIANWDCPLTDNDTDRIVFGESNSALTRDQLRNIIFTNPNGLTGDYTARILVTGEIMPAFIPGDANMDGKVDDADATIMATYWQATSDATWGMGDFNGDYAVNDIDATIMAANWQRGASGAVPESGTLTLLATCGLMLLGLGARRWKR